MTQWYFFQINTKQNIRELIQPLARPLNEIRQLMHSSQQSSLHMDKYHCQSTSILGLLLFLIYINNLSEGLSIRAKLFAENTSLFSVIHDSQTSANDLNEDLEMIHNWVFQWKINFNTDPTKPAQEVIFSHKTKKLPHAPLVSNNANVT